MNKTRAFLLAKRGSMQNTTYSAGTLAPVCHVTPENVQSKSVCTNKPVCHVTPGNKPAIAFSAEERALRDEKCLFVKMVLEFHGRNRISVKRAAAAVAADSPQLFPRLREKGNLLHAYSNFRNWTDGRPDRPGLRNPLTGKIDFSRRDLLLRNYGHRPERRGDPAFWRAVLAMFLHVQKPQLAKIYRTLAAHWMADYPAHPLPSKAMVDYYIKNTYPKRLLALARKGENYYIQHFRDYVERDPDTIRPNECWVADNRQLDFYVRVKDGDGWKAVRPWVCVILDVKSEYVVSFQLTEDTVTSVTIRNGLADGIVKYGRPAVFLTDNGKDYTARGFCRPVIFTPGVDNSEVYEHCIMRELDIECRQSLPYAAQSKVVERFNREMAEYDRLQRGYVGNKPSERPAAADVWAKPENCEYLMSVQQAAEYLRKFIEVYHAKPAERSRFLRGMSPARAFTPNLRLSRPALTYDEMYFAFLKPLTTSRTVDGRGPAVWCGKQRFVAVEPRLLWPYDGKRVMVKFDNVTADHCFVFELSGEFICECRQPGYLPYFARSEEEHARLGEALRNRNRERAELQAWIYQETGGFHKLDPATINLLPRETLLANARLRKLDTKHSVGGETHNPAIYVLPKEVPPRSLPEPVPELEFREDEEEAELAAAHELLTRPPRKSDDDALDLSIAHNFITNNHKGDDDDEY